LTASIGTFVSSFPVYTRSIPFPAHQRSDASFTRRAAAAAVLTPRRREVVLRTPLVRDHLKQAERDRPVAIKGGRAPFPAQIGRLECPDHPLVVAQLQVVLARRIGSRGDVEVVERLGMVAELGERREPQPLAPEPGLERPEFVRVTSRRSTEEKMSNRRSTNPCRSANASPSEPFRAKLSTERAPIAAR